MTKDTIVVAVALALAGPFLVASASADDGPDDNATWGLCTAKNVSELGNEASNGTVNATPAFSNLSEEDCEDAEDPWNGSPGDDHIPGDPGGNESPGDPGGNESPGEPGPP